MRILFDVKADFLGSLQQGVSIDYLISLHNIDGAGGL